MLQFLCINFTIDVYHLCLILSSHTLVKDICMHLCFCSCRPVHSFLFNAAVDWLPGSASPYGCSRKSAIYLLIYRKYFNCCKFYFQQEWVKIKVDWLVGRYFSLFRKTEVLEAMEVYDERCHSMKIIFSHQNVSGAGSLIFEFLRQWQFIFNRSVNRKEKKSTLSRKKTKILTVNRNRH